jgi:hypothetical protein
MEISSGTPSIGESPILHPGDFNNDDIRVVLDYLVEVTVL